MKSGQTLDGKLWLVIAVACCLTAIPFTLDGFRVPQNVLADRMQLPLLCLVAGGLLTSISATVRLGTALQGISQMSLSALFGVMLCYLAATGGRPLIDAQLLHVDRLLGYDWFEYAVFCADHPHLYGILTSSYYAAYFLPIVIAVALNLAGQKGRYETFLLAMMIGSALTSGVFYFLPATTAWSYLGQDRLASRLLVDLPVSSSGWIGELLRLRQGGNRTLMAAQGLVAFPSYHCVMALTYIWAVWSLRPLRPPFIVSGVLTIASAPLVGGHYVADLLGGAIVAMIAIPVARRAHAMLRHAEFPLPIRSVPRRTPRFARSASIADALAHRGDAAVPGPSRHIGSRTSR